ncbi:MAG: acyltransferase [Thermodesulfobacteriota bacterium]
MLHFLPAPLRGAIALFLYAVNTIGCFITMIPFMLLKAIVFHENARNFFTTVLMNLGTAWVTLNSLILRLTQNIEIKREVEEEAGFEHFSTRKSYLVISNHRSWADILLLQHIFNRRIPYLKFFLKKELIWVPLLGIAWWALDFPFMKRYPKEYLEKHPEQKGKDIETTRKYCEKFKYSPISVINFLEGTRFDRKKQEKQQSPFRHLLKPRAGGIGIVLSSMGEHLSRIIDVTIVYPENRPPIPFWEFLKGNIPVAVIHIRSYPIPEKFAGKNYETDAVFKTDFQQWINQIWMEKDERIEKILNP